jgi:hypothetical protein
MSNGVHTELMFHSLKQFIVDMKGTFIASMALSVVAILIEYIFDI